MEERVRRPISVWIAQIVLLIFAVMFIVILVVSLAAPANAGIPIAGMLIAIAINLFLSSLCLASFVGMARRKRYGRWIGVTVLSLFLISVILGSLQRPAGPYSYYEYSNATQRIAGIATEIVLTGLFLLLILRLAFAKRVTAFFGPVVPTGSATPPPPPPTFDD